MVSHTNPMLPIFKRKTKNRKQKISLGFVCRRAGFTLVELLIVMAVMSILVGIGINTFSIAQKKARDARRKADLRQIQTALEIYRQDYGYYPSGTCADGNVCLMNSKSTSTPWLAGLDSNYIGSLPKDPINNNPSGGQAYSADKDYIYTYHIEEEMHDGPGTARGYSLVTQLEDANDPDACSKKDYYMPSGTRRWCASPPTSGVDPTAAPKLFVVTSRY